MAMKQVTKKLLVRLGKSRTHKVGGICNIKRNLNPNLGGGNFTPPPPVGFPLITQKR